ncbi:tRNA 2-thiouridine(34) synthase MnmA [Azospirillum picis]|uniref:tRNA-specific 2-thiouridylase MnmA n=1 Tax=Azospirillum picis TaxID=488438 RepID=A0ABU0MJD7_9PROT|nr:tRNA 2-thiouridine(34) synthase MnmA [Azospirillum picis]MBP2299470.1 tRNA-specific 2-thiouridylase [Azospirillum picis]MDQ0533403.1 tRNA-specific 2-thiouridylase [Azospirillum picis]
MNSLGLPKRPQDTRVVVAMSGGVDSSVTAAMLREEGYDVVGITLQLYDHGLALQKPGACCAGQDIYDARQVSDRIGIPHYVLDYEGRFSQDVMDDFADSYLRGETPIPCVRCNQRVKFRDLLNTARDLGAEALATGHYVRRVTGRQGAELHRAIDPAKDQSYFLFATTREQLDFLRFPLGGLTKPETRALAERYELEVAAKPDSQDICFVPNGNYAEVVAKLRPGSVEPGDIVHVDGRVLGRHKGVVHYTVGQRKGLGIGGIRGQEEEALYVVRLEPARRRVVVGPRRDLARALVTVRDVNWLAADMAEGQSVEVSVKLRSAQPAAPATWRAGPDGTARVELHEPQHGIAPGQACVVYQEDRVLGGGWISGTAAAA